MLPFHTVYNTNTSLHSLSFPFFLMRSHAQTIAFTFLDDMFTWRAAADVVLRRPLAFAIVDEADSILIDRSVEPHVLSGAPQGGDDPLQYRIACMVRQLPIKCLYMGHIGHTYGIQHN